METDPWIKNYQEKVCEMLIECIPTLIENLNKLPPDEYVKYYAMLLNMVKRRNKQS